MTERFAPGEVGKLWVRGLHTDARFLNNPELDAGRRINGYFDLQELGKRDKEGNIVLMGREHDLIIRGGQNIFPADVEAALSQHPKILEVSVVGICPIRRWAKGSARLWFAATANPIDLVEINSFLKEKGLARFKWPERIGNCKLAAASRFRLQDRQEKAQGKFPRSCGFTMIALVHCSRFNGL